VDHGLSAVPEHRHTIFYICTVFSTAGFARVFLEKRLELKSLKRQTKAKELGGRAPELLIFRLSLKAL
jgi:hypothetical protein